MNHELLEVGQYEYTNTHDQWSKVLKCSKITRSVRAVLPDSSPQVTGRYSAVSNLLIYFIRKHFLGVASLGFQIRICVNNLSSFQKQTLNPTRHMNWVLVHRFGNQLCAVMRSVLINTFKLTILYGPNNCVQSWMWHLHSFSVCSGNLVLVKSS